MYRDVQELVRTGCYWPVVENTSTKILDLPLLASEAYIELNGLQKDLDDNFNGKING